MVMKPVQIMLDEELLAQLDATDEVQRDGRSAVLRRAVAEYLKRGRALQIRDGYRAAYGSAPGIGRELEGWEDEGSWPAE
jgi:metal-responsive CopG/Arc/MetJ family transcriptional regulator